MTGTGVQALSAAVNSASKEDNIGSGIESFLYYARASVRLKKVKTVSARDNVALFL